MVYLKNTIPHLKKHDDRSSPMVYLGVEEGCKTHYLFDLSRGKLEVSGDVIFQENLKWKWKVEANNEEELQEFNILHKLYSNEVTIEVDEGDTRTVAKIITIPSSPTCPVTSSPSTLLSNAYTSTAPLMSTSSESHDGPIRFRSITDIYANTKEVAVTIDEEESKVKMKVSKEYVRKTSTICKYTLSTSNIILSTRYLLHKDYFYTFYCETKH